MKNKNYETKKVVHFLIVILMLLAIVFGLVFSSIQTSRGIKLGSQYRGSYQALVGTYKVDGQTDEDNSRLPNADANEAADVLQNKLSPFADGSINITVDGMSRLIVTAPRDAYNNQQRLFVNAIQSTGGLFIFDDQNTDVMLNTQLMTTAGLNGNLTEKSPTSELLGKVEQVSESIGMTNRPFLKFLLNNDSFEKLNQGSGENPQAPTLKMVVDAPTLLDTIRQYFTLADGNSQRDEYLKNFLAEIINPLQSKIGTAIKGSEADILKDFFQISYWKTTSNGTWTTDKASLVDPSFIGNYLDVDDFKELLFADDNVDHEFEYLGDLTKYTYDPNAVGADFETVDNKVGKYSQKLTFGSTETTVNEAFNTLTKILFPILTSGKMDPTNNPFAINQHLNQDLFADFFIYNGALSQPIAISENFPGSYQGTIRKDGFYLGTKNYTVAKTAAALISQTTAGFTFHVFSVATIDAIISQAMFIISVIALLIIALAISLFMLFFYRLLGLFTIIIAAIIGSLTLLMNVVFGIVVGPEIIAIMFVLIGLIMDISVVMFEAFKNNIYLEKRPLIASFNISNRETLGLVVDVLLASLLPNIVLFWIGIGFLKNFATILTMGILFTFIFGVVVLRILIYFVARTSIWKNAPWTLPIDTSLNYEGRFLNHYLILMKEEKLAGYTGKTQLSAAELLKIKKLETQIQTLRKKDQVFIEKKKQKLEARNLRIQEKWKKQLKLYQKKKTKLKKKTGWALSLANHYNQKIDYLKYLISGGDKQNEEAVLLSSQLTQIETQTRKTGVVTLLVTIILTVVALVFAFTIGLNYSVNYGKGTQYYLYGSTISNTYNNALGAPDSIREFNNVPQGEEIKTRLSTIYQESKATILKKHDLENADNVEQQIYAHEWEALGVYQAYHYLISNNYFKYLDSRLNGVDFKNVIYLYGADYSMFDSTNSSFKDQPWVAITITNNLISKNNAVKTAFQKFALQWNGTNRPSAPTNDGGVLGMTMEPHTATKQMQQIGITFGIILLALLVYMLIRFKWTYYVALALGLLVTLALTISLVVVLRIPFSLEALAGILGVLSFALISGMLFLGRGKSIIVSKDEKSLNDYFNQEIGLQAQKKHLQLAFKTQVQKMKKTARKEVKVLNKKDENFSKLKKALRKKHRKELAKFKNEQKVILKKQFQEINAQINLEAHKNNFLKEIFANVLRFGILRTVFLTSFYLVVGIVVAVTLPSIGIMGFTLAAGVVGATLVMITIVLPLWIYLERRRIRMRYGYKKFVNNLKVTNEEQIITGLND